MKHFNSLIIVPSLLVVRLVYVGPLKVHVGFNSISVQCTVLGIKPSSVVDSEFNIEGMLFFLINGKYCY